MRVYVTKEIKRSVVVKADDTLNKKDLLQCLKEVAQATKDEILTWIRNNCFEIATLKEASNLMTSRYVAKWKIVQGKRIIRMRLCLRGFQDVEAFDVETFAGTANRRSQRILASEAACHPEWIIASLDVEKAFLKGVHIRRIVQSDRGTSEECLLHVASMVSTGAPNDSRLAKA